MDPHFGAGLWTTGVHGHLFLNNEKIMNKKRNSAKKKQQQPIARMISNNLENQVHGHFFSLQKGFGLCPWTLFNNEK